MRVRFAATVVAVVLASILGAPPAHAAALATDTLRGAKPVSIGFSEVVDTSTATTDADDAQLNENCGAPATDASVWYTITAATDSPVLIDVSGSDYTAGVLVGAGEPGALGPVACGQDSVVFTAVAGFTYYLLVVDDQRDGGGNGGRLNISVVAGPPGPTVTLTVAARGTVDRKTGAATLHGRYTCRGADFVDLSGEVNQTARRGVTVRGSFGFRESGTCDGAKHRWSATVHPERGKFKPGQSMAVLLTFACGPSDCFSGFDQYRVKLRVVGK